MKKLTKEEFIEKAKQVHGDKYDYSQSNFVNSRTLIKIVCSKHGEFWQTPDNHLHNHGCQKCAIELTASKLSSKKEEFIKTAKEIHGDKYDYSKADYVNSNTKVEIICPEHGTFWQVPSNHINRKQGCPKCGVINSITNKRKQKKYTDKETFISIARKIHGDRYDYSLVEYKGHSHKVKIICQEHGVFEQAPYVHIRGCGCPKCSVEVMSKNFSKTTEQFISEAIALHGERLDYSKVNYVNTETPVEIICPKHGNFWQRPSVHLRKDFCGCPSCSKEIADIKQTKTLEDFIKQAELVHGNKYDYSKVNYINSLNKVEIICKEHGSFWQLPRPHLSGQGCPTCSCSSLEREIEVMLKENHIPFIPQANKSHLEWMGLQKLDFYLPDYNVAIECQGIQHFKAHEFFGGDDGLKATQERDERKKKKCQDNGVKLLYFSDKQYKPDIYIDKNIILQEIKKEDAKLRADAEGLRNVLSG